jgi:transcriptional regulator with XRE-family HTH domain
MAKTEIEKWLDESEENRRLFAQEDFILEVTEAIWERMEKLGISKKDLAQHMGRSQAYITQLLNGSRNMTLRTLADIAHALDVKPKFGFVDEENVFSQQLNVHRAESLFEKPVMVAGEEEGQWSQYKHIIHTRPNLKAVA